jgi:hypothetical protein
LSPTDRLLCLVVCPQSNCGLDSFSFLELSGRIKGDLGVDLPTAQLTSTTTIEEVVDMLMALIGQAGTGEEEEADKNGPRALSRAASVSGDAGVAPRKVLSIPTVDASRVRSVFEVEQYDEVREAKALPDLKAAVRSKGKSRVSDDDTLDTTTSTPGCLRKSLYPRSPLEPSHSPVVRGAGSFLSQPDSPFSAFVLSLCPSHVAPRVCPGPCGASRRPPSSSGRAGAHERRRG